MFVQREWLEHRLDLGLSLAAIGREAGRHPSTVGYWIKRHGLQAAGAGRYAARGPLAREQLEALAASGLPLREIARRTDRSVATVRYWLKRWDVARALSASRTPDDPGNAPRVAELECKRHGLTEFVLEGRGRYRCKRCRQERVSAWRRRVKRLLVAEAGGRCLACGYSECVAALQFHHLDPAAKSFALSHRGLARALADVRAEAAKCVLLCANCHAEVEAGHRALAVAAT